MIWFLLGSGVVLILLGLWGGPQRRSRPDKASRIPKDSTVQEAWNILTSPVQYEDELIKIPDSKPWRVSGKDRRFNQGLLVGLGLGLVIMTFLVPFLPGAALTDGQAPVDPAQGETAKSNGQSATQGDSPAQGQQQTAAPNPTPTPPAPAPTPAPTPEPQVITFEVAEGSSSQDIASHLKQLGLIPNEQEFLNLVTAYGKETALKAGTFELPKGASVDAVIAKLTE